LEVEVEGYTRRQDNDRGSAVDVVSAGYFSTLGVPILAGREILESDNAGAPKTCVINEAFAKKFFDGRSPIGKAIISREGDTRWSCQVVGIAKDARTQSLRGDIQPRYFVPAMQAPFKPGIYVFLVRTATAEAAGVLAELQQVIQHAGPALSGASFQSIEEQLTPLTARDRITTQLVIVFGSAALALAAIGLYGVLSYSIMRRRSEIAIRIALGAQRRGLIALFLRETMRFVFIGIAFGSGLAYIESRFIQSQLFGVTPQDPIILGSTICLLILVALTASYIPALRASKLDPIVALREE
jgi:putative ABC transport system permease protein